MRLDGLQTPPVHEVPIGQSTFSSQGSSSVQLGSLQAGRQLASRVHWRSSQPSARTESKPSSGQTTAVLLTIIPQSVSAPRRTAQRRRLTSRTPIGALLGRVRGNCNGKLWRHSVI